MNDSQILAINSFFDSATHTVTYVVADRLSRYCAIIDPVLDFDLSSGNVTTGSADTIIEFINSRNYQTEWILETHAHADHLSAAQYLKNQVGGAVAIGNRIPEVQATFKSVFNLGDDFQPDGSQFDYLFSDEESFQLGDLDCRCLHTPGHTPACSSYIVGKNIFVGDTLFMPDYGTARTDFPGGDAATLYQSIHRLYDMPDETHLYMCHDYLPSSRGEYLWKCTVADQKNSNIHINMNVSEAEFVKQRTERDSTLSAPKLIYPSIQVNIRAGHLPKLEENHKSYLKLPLAGLVTL
jgi:glyoxylase-like metal-dependent hydrolase (beta-lactamase superfamily II)